MLALATLLVGPTIAGGDALPTPFRVIAHRGASGYAPENTLPAFERARQLGAPEVELDVQLSKDGVVMLFHDRTLDQKTNGSGRVRDHAASALRKLDIGTWFDATHPEVEQKFAGTGLVDLPEVFQTFGDAFVYHVEIKSEDEELPGLTLAVIERFGLGERVMMTSFQWPALQRLRALEPDVPIGVLAADEAGLRGGGAQEAPPAIPSLLALQQREVDRAVEERFDLIGFPSRELSAEIIAYGHARGLEVRAWRVKSPEDMERAIRLGANGMTIDWPDRLLARIAELERAGAPPSPMAPRGSAP